MSKLILRPLLFPLAPILSDLQRRMVYVGRFRQVGKTTLSLALLGKGATETHPAYFNCDNVQDRTRLLEGQLPSGPYFW